MKWERTSEIVGGFVLLDKLDPNAVNPDDLYPPLCEIIPLKRDGKEKTEVIDKIGFTAWDAAVTAAKKVNGDLTPLEWVKMLERDASRATAGGRLAKVAERLTKGEDVDTGLALQAISMIDFGYRELTPMSEVDPQQGAWVKTGYDPIDKNTYGIPDSSMTILGASPGVGKTTLMLKICKSMAKKYTKSKVAIFSLEMTMAQITARALEIDDMDDDTRSRILMSDSSYTVHEIYAVAARAASHNNLCLIAIDFADLMVEGEQSEATMGAIYRELATLAKKTGVPVLLISQLNRETYRGGVPKINHLRYSGLAEATAALILLVHNPNNILADFAADTGALPRVQGKGYIIVGKSRFGFRHGSPGAIQVDWDGKTGWGDKSHAWFELTV